MNKFKVGDKVSYCYDDSHRYEGIIVENHSCFNSYLYLCQLEGFKLN